MASAPRRAMLATGPYLETGLAECTDSALERLRRAGAAMAEASRGASLDYDRNPGAHTRLDAAWHRAALALQALVELETRTRQTNRLLGCFPRQPTTKETP